MPKFTKPSPPASLTHSYLTSSQPVMNAILRFCYVTLLLLCAMPAAAFFDSTIGRWASRDP